jgi:hypothetical protein
VRRLGGKRGVGHGARVRMGGPEDEILTIPVTVSALAIARSPHSPTIYTLTSSLTQPVSGRFHVRPPKQFATPLTTYSDAVRAGLVALHGDAHAGCDTFRT